MRVGRTKDAFSIRDMFIWIAMILGLPNIWKRSSRNQIPGNISHPVSLNKTYKLLKRIIGKLLPGGILIMANTVDLPKNIPESAITERPIIDCYYNLISSQIKPALKVTYSENKLGRTYEYQIWAFER